ncbi:MAG: hypothetical protein ABMA64_21355 [Myxococcota bacterium]
MNHTWWMVALVGCVGGTSKSDTGTIGDTETDTDTDADADADVDTDADADTGGPAATGDTAAPADPCFADWTQSVDGVARFEGTNTYDPAHVDRIWSLDLFLVGQPAHTRVEWTYDAAGRVTHIGSDYNDDGVEDGAEDWTYDAAGNELSYVNDNPAYPIFEAYFHTYDAANLRIETAEERDGDGVFDRVTTFTYDAAGGLAREAIDEGVDGIVDYAVEYTRDALGRETLRTEDLGDDGVLESTATTEYDAAGPNTWVTSTDDGVDGVVDQVEVSENDALGNLVYYSSDGAPADGVVDYELTQTWDPVSGLLTSQVMSSTLRTDEVTRTYDALDRILTWRTVYDTTGLPEVWEDVFVYGGVCPSP